MNPLERIHGRERKRTGQHLVERDAGCVEVAARIDRAVHASGLFWCHVRQSAGDDFRGLRGLTLTWHARGHTEARQRDAPASGVHQDVAWLHVPMDEAALV